MFHLLFPSLVKPMPQPKLFLTEYVCITLNNICITFLINNAFCLHQQNFGKVVFNDKFQSVIVEILIICIIRTVQYDKYGSCCYSQHFFIFFSSSRIRPRMIIFFFQSSLYIKGSSSLTS